MERVRHKISEDTGEEEISVNCQEDVITEEVVSQETVDLHCCLRMRSALHSSYFAAEANEFHSACSSPISLSFASPAGSTGITAL